MLCVDSNRRNNVNILHFSFAGEVYYYIKKYDYEFIS